MEVIIALLISIVFIIGGFLEIAILSAPGAFIRRLFSGHKKPFKKLYKERIFLNYILGLITVLVLYITIVLVVKLFLTGPVFG
jgi:hypothetical protein